MNIPLSTHETLLSQLGKSIGEIGKEIRLQHGHDFTCVTAALDQVIAIIGSHETINVKQIAKLLLITSGAATQHIAALEKIEAVKRVMSEHDRREVIVQLTPKGRVLYSQIYARKHELLQIIFGGLDDHELQTMVDLLNKVRETSKEHTI